MFARGHISLLPLVYLSLSLLLSLVSLSLSFPFFPLLSFLLLISFAFSPYPCLFYPLSLLPFLPLISPILPFLSSFSCLSHPLPHPPPCPLPSADEPAISTVTSNRLTSNDFEVVKVIGRGAFGEVQLVSHYIHHL